MKSNKYNKVATLFRIVSFSGPVFIVSGLICLIVKALSPESIDACGTLHEAFFLLPAGFGLIATGLLISILCLIISIIERTKHK